MTTFLAPWTERLIWLVVGVALATAGFVVWSSAPGTEALEPGAQAPVADSRPADSSADRPQASPGDGAAAPRPECYLGVVLARDASDVTADADGILEEVRVRVGDRVERGAVIARLDTVVLGQQLDSERANLRRAEAHLRRVEVEADQSEQENERRLALDREGLLSQEDKETARFDREKAQADLEAARAETAQAEARVRQLETSLARAEIRAPFDGTVAQRYLDPGARASPALPVVRLISSGSLIARFAVPPEETARVPVETEVRVEVESMGRAFPGTVEHLAPEVDAAAQMVFVEAGLEVARPLTSEISSGAVARVSVAAAGTAPTCLESPPSP